MPLVKAVNFEAPDVKSWFVQVFEDFEKLWKWIIPYHFTGPGKFWEKICFFKMAMEKFWIFV